MHRDLESAPIEREAADFSKCFACDSVDEPGRKLGEKFFCDVCLADAKLDNFSLTDLEETHSLSYLESWGAGLKSTFIVATFLSILIISIFVLLGAGFVAQKVWMGQIAAVDLLRMAFNVLRFFGFVWIIIFVFCCFITFFACIVPLQNRISVEGDKLVVKTRWRTSKTPLDDCSWKTTKWGVEGMLYLLSNSPRIQLTYGEKQTTTVGWSDESFLLWGKFLRLYDVHYARFPPLKTSIMTMAKHIFGGGCLGLLFGILIAFVTGHPGWVTIGVFLGFIDGAILGVWEILFDSISPDKVKKKASPALFALMAAVLGVKIGRLEGLTGFFVCGIVNGIIGWMIGHKIRSKANEANDTKDEDFNANST